MSFEDYDLNPVRLALDLASFGLGAVSAEELIERQRRMLTDHGYPGRLAQIPGRDLSRLRELGREVAGVLETAGQEPFISALAALLDAQDCRPQLTMHDGAPHLHYAREGAPLPDWVATMAASGLVLYVCRFGRSRLRPLVRGRVQERVAPVLLGLLRQPDDGGRVSPPSDRWSPGMMDPWTPST